MLTHLSIRNFAVIDSVDLEFNEGFTVITGETGAGKSVLVGALNLLLGGRASTDAIRSGADQADLEALFDISDHPPIKARLEARELMGDDPDSLVIRRQLRRKGRGKIIVNGHLATMAGLTEIVRGLVDISGQHEQQSLLWTDQHIEYLDAFGELEPLKSSYQEAYQHYADLQRELHGLEKRGEEDARRQDFLRYQLDEIERIRPIDGEYAELQKERGRLKHAGRIRQSCEEAEAQLYANDHAAVDLLGTALGALECIPEDSCEDSVQEAEQLIKEARTAVEEAARILGRYAQGVEVDPLRLEAVEARTAELEQLFRKHGPNESTIVAEAERIATELERLNNRDNHLTDLSTALERAQEQGIKRAGALSQSRQKAAMAFQNSIQKELADMELENARFEVHLHTSEKLGAQGIDGVEFLWSANPGEPVKSLARIASGGELSRVMLAVKTILSQRDLVSLYIFDEVDTGVGGRAADAIGRKISNVCKGHQAITITHLAPIAARADHHLFVHKTTENGRTMSKFDELNGRTRVEELARMIDGAQITTATKRAAKEMLARMP